MHTYNYEIAPTNSANREEHKKLTLTGTLQARNIGTATQEASRIAAETSKKPEYRGLDFGVVRVY